MRTAWIAPPKLTERLCVPQWMEMFMRRGFLCLSLVLLLTGTVKAATPETLLIGPGDLLHFQVADTPEMDQHPRVTDSGEVPIEGVGNVKVSGMTPAVA